LHRSGRKGGKIATPLAALPVGELANSVSILKINCTQKIGETAIYAALELVGGFKMY
jgi:hypothetical protein